MSFTHNPRRPQWLGRCLIDCSRFPGMMRWNSVVIPKIDCLPHKVILTVAQDLRGQALSAIIKLPDEQCVGPIRSQWDVPVTLRGSCKLCVDLPESLADCVTEGRFEIVVYQGCDECARCPIDFIAKQDIKRVETERPDNKAKGCC